MKELLKSQKTRIIVSMAFAAMLAIICSAIALYGIDLFSASADDTNTVSSSDNKVSMIAAASPEFSVSAVGDTVNVRVTRLIDGEVYPLPENTNTSSFKEALSQGSYEYISPFEAEYESTVVAGNRVQYQYIRTDRYKCDNENFELYYLLSDGTKNDISYTYSYNGNYKYINFTVPSVDNIEEMVINIPYTTLPDPHKISVQRDKNNLRLTMARYDSSFEKANCFYNSPTGLTGSISAAAQATNGADLDSALYIDGVTYAQSGLVFTMTGSDISGRDAFTLTGAKIYTADVDGNYTVERSDLISYDDSTGKYVITMPDEDILIAVTSQNNIHKVKVDISDPDYSLLNVNLHTASSTGQTNSTTYSYYTEDLTKANSNYTITASGGSAVDTVYHNPGSYKYIYLRFDKPSTSSKADIYQLENVKIYKMNSDGSRGDDITDDETTELQYGINGVSGTDNTVYLMIAPQEFDIIISCTFRMVLDTHSIYIYEKTHDNGDVWGNSFNGVLTYNAGTETSQPSSSLKNFSYLNKDKNTLYKMENILQGEVVKYWLYTGNGNLNTTNWATVKSWHVYEADENGNPVGEPIESELGLTLPDEPVISASYYYFQSAVFNMPDKDIIFYVEYGETKSPMRVEQFVVAEDGTKTFAGSEFRLDFSGVKGENASEFSSLGDSFTAVSTEESPYFDFWLVKGPQSMSFTPHIKDGYEITSLKIYCTTNLESGNFLETTSNNFTDLYLTLGDGDFSFNEDTLKNIHKYAYHMVVTYEKASTVTITQKTDGIVIDGSANIARVTASAAEGGLNETNVPFFNCENSEYSYNVVNTFYSQTIYTLKSSERSDTFNMAYGVKMKFVVQILDHTRIIGGFKVYKEVDGEKVDLEYTKESSSYSQATYTLNESIAGYENVFVEVEYKTASKLTVGIFIKNGESDYSLLPNTSGTTAEVTGTGAETEKAFAPLAGGEYVDSFTVGADKAEYTTVGQTQLSINIANVPDDYVIANVDATQMDSAGNPGASIWGMVSATGEATDLGESRDFSRCTFKMTGGNVYIRIILARTTQVRIRFNSRGDSSADRFVANTLEPANLTLSYTNTAYGSYVYPVIVENKYNVASYTITKQPSERTVNVLERTSLSGSFAIPEGYFVASVFSTRKKVSSDESTEYEAEDVDFNIGNYRFTSAATNGTGQTMCEGTFSLAKAVEFGYEYDITINVEKVTETEINSFHSTQDGKFVSNYDVSDCIADLYGKRTGESAAYNSDKPIIAKKGLSVYNYLRTLKIEAAVEGYVFRDTDMWIKAKPVEGEVVSSLKVYFESDTDTLIPTTFTGIDDEGWWTYTISEKTKMGDKMIADVYFSAELSGTLNIYNQTTDGTPLNEHSYTRLYISNKAYENPVYNVDTGEMLKQIESYAEEQHYRVMTNSSGSVNTIAENGWILDKCLIKRHDEDEFTICGSSCTLGTGDFISDKQITMQNTFRPAAKVEINQFMDVTDDWSSNASNKGYTAITAVNPTMGDEYALWYEDRYTSSIGSGSQYSKRVSEGSTMTMRVTAKSGYTLDHVDVYKEGEFLFTVTPDQMTRESGKVYSYVFPFVTEQLFGDGYEINVYYTAEYVRITQSCLNGKNQKGCLGTISSISYVDTDDIEDISIDDVMSSSGNIGFCSGAKPRLKISPHYSHRIVEIWFGDSAATMRKILGDEGGLEWGETYTLAEFEGEPITSDKYLTVVYELKESEPVIKPEPPVVKPVNSLLTVNVYESDGSAYVLSTDYNVTLSVPEADDGSISVYQDGAFTTIEGTEFSLPHNGSATASYSIPKGCKVCVKSSVKEAFRLEKALLVNGSSGSSSLLGVSAVNDGTSASIGYFTLSSGNYTLNLYFSRPVLELGTNNTLTTFKGAVTVNGETAIAENEYMKAINFDSGSALSLSIEPQEGYEFAYILAGDSRDDMNTVEESQITRSEDGSAVVNFAERSKDLHVQVQFNRISQISYASLVVSHYMPNSSGIYQLSEMGFVNVYGAHNFISEPILYNDLSVESFDLTTEGSISADIHEGSYLKLTVTPPENHIVNKIKAVSIDEYGVVSDIELTNADNVYNLTEAAVIDRTIIIDVYYNNGYNIYYNGNGFTDGDIPEDSTVYYEGNNATVLGSGSMVRANYKFSGWSLVGGDENTVDYNAGDTITFANGDINLYAVWTEDAKYSVTYNGNGNTGGEAPVDGLSPYYAGTSAEILGQGTLEKTNYSFIGWNTDSSAATAQYQAEDTVEITGNLTLYAIWQENPKCTVTYKDLLDSAASVSETLYKDSTTQVKSAAEAGFVHPEYNFAGWDVSDANYSVEPGAEITVTSDVTYTAQWTPKNYDVIYLAEDDSEITTQPHAFGTSVTVGSGVTTPTITGKTFTHWELIEGTVTVSDGEFTMPAGTVKFKAVYEFIEYTVKYVITGTVPDGYTKPADVQYHYGDTVTVAAAPSGYDTARYNFSGWTSGDVDITSGSFTMPDIASQVVTITGEFTENDKVNLTYHPNGGTPESAVPSAESAYTTLSTTVKAPADPFGRTGYNFVGWNTADDGSGTRYTSGNPLKLTSDLTLYAEWEKANFTVEYYPETGDVPITSEQHAYQSEVIVGENVTAPKVDGKTFTRWELIGGNVTVSDGKFTMPAETVKFRAVYTFIEYSVKYVLTGTVPDGISAPTDGGTYHFGDNVTLRAVPSGYDTARYNFSGWSTTDAVISGGSFTMPEIAGGVVTITGTFTENGKVNLIYNANGGTPESAVPSAESAYTTLSTTAKAPADSFGKVGYEFIGWNTAANGLGDSYAVNAAIEITTDTTLYAQWKKASFNVEYYGEGGGELITSKAYEYETSVTVGENVVAPKISGKTFTCWELIEGNVTVSGGKFTMPAETVKFRAVYEFIEYTLKYVLTGTVPGGCTKPADTSYHYGDTVTVAAAPSGYDTARYNFSGWTSSDVDITSGSFAMPDIASRVVTITGTFTENNKVNLTYHPNGGTPESAVPSAESAYTSLSSTVKAPAASFGKVGYEFTGWNTKSDGSGDAYAVGAAIQITADTTLYVQWKIKNYAVEYYNESGSSLLGSQNYTYRSTVTVGADASAPAIDGKVFSHWTLIDSNQTDADGTAIAARQQFTMPAATVQFRAVYTSLEYTVTYAVSGSIPDGYTAPLDNSVYHYNDTVNVFAAPTAEDYTFKGWTLNGVDYAVNTPNSSFEIKANVTLVGVWTKNEPYDPSTAVITYISGVDTTDASDPLAAKYTFEAQLGEDYTVLTNIWYEREGYEFKNWVVVNNEVTGLSLIDSIIALFTGTPNVGDKLVGGDIIESLSGPVTLKAEWETIEYHITYDGNQNTGGSAPIDSNTYTYGENATVLEKGDLVKKGFRFAGWNTSPYGTGTSYKAGDVISMTEDVTLYAVWHTTDDPTALYVTYDKNGADSGTAPLDETKYKAGDSVTVKDKGNLARTNYTFKEWNTKSDGKGTSYKAGDVFTMPDNNVTLYAIWVDSGGNIPAPSPDTPSPGTGEGIAGTVLAIAAIIAAAGAAVFIVMRERKKRRLA